LASTNVPSGSTTATCVPAVPNHLFVRDNEGDQGGGDQGVLAAEMIVERPLGEARLRGDCLHAHRADPDAVEEAARGIDDAGARLERVTSHVFPMYTD
jgi:hypothetical protein